MESCGAAGWTDVKRMSYSSAVLCCVLAVVLGAAQLQPAAFPRRPGAEERGRVGETGFTRRQRDARQSGGRHRSADAGQQPRTRSAEESGYT